MIPAAAPTNSTRDRGLAWTVTLAAIPIAMPALVALMHPSPPPWAAIPLSGALSLLLLAAAVALVPWLPIVAAAIGTVVSLIAVITIGAGIADAVFSPERLLLATPGGLAGGHPRAVSLNAAIAFLMGGVALILLARRSRREHRVRTEPPAVSLGAACALVAAGALLLRPSVEADAFDLRAFPPMEMATALGLLVAGVTLAGIAWRRLHASGFRNRSMLPSAIGLALLLVSYNLWQALTAHSLARLDDETVQVLDRVYQSVAERVSGQLNLMQRMARRWAAGPTQPGAAQWQEDAELLLAHFPYIDGVGLTDARWIYRYASYRGGPRQVIGSRADRDPLRRRAFQAAVTRNEVRVTPALRLIQGGLGFVIVAPMQHAGRPAGLALAGVYFKDLLQLSNGGYPSGFLFRVAEDGREVYRYPQAQDETRNEFARSRQLELPGSQWRLSVWPTPAHTLASVGPLPGLVLLFGVVTGALAWTVLWFGQLSASRSRQLVQVTHILEAQVAERRKAEGEVRTLNTELEDRVQQRTRELRETNEELETFSYSVSHDLRAPLASIAGFSKMLADQHGGALGEEGLHYVRRIGNNVTRMGQIIDDLLDLARVSRSELHCQPVDLSMLARSIMARLTEQAPQRRIDYRIADDLRVRADPNLMSIVLENLLANAVKFTATRPVATIEVGCETTQDRRVLFVRDNGVGFDMAFAGKLFGVFQRLHSSSEFPGNGIGLATVRRVIARHRGEIWAKGEPDNGAVFFFWLPD